MPWTVFNSQGQRKYLTGAEMDAFVIEARSQSIDVMTFCCMLAYTGCRISEVLSLTPRHIDFEAENLVVRCLKKRGKRVFRAIPLPDRFLHDLRRWFARLGDPHAPLWPWSRMTGYRRVKEVMDLAGITGSYATPKGLRHGFGVRAIQAQVPLTLVQRWLGHADIKTTTIYTSAIGPEERQIASRMWVANDRQPPEPADASQTRPALRAQPPKLDACGTMTRGSAISRAPLSPSPSLAAHVRLRVPDIGSVFRRAKPNVAIAADLVAATAPARPGPVPVPRSLLRRLLLAGRTMVKQPVVRAAWIPGPVPKP